MVKKICALCLSMILIFPAMLTLADENQKAQANEYTGLLKAISVFDDEDNLDQIVTRAEFAGYIARILEVDEYIRKDERYFADVPATYWKSNSINGLAARGIINGNGDSTFRPDDNITYSEAVTILIKAMGYDSRAKFEGGYPAGYIKTAVDLKISSDIKMNAETLTKASVARLLYNALDTVVLQFSGFGSKGTEYNSTTGHTFLYQTKSIRRGTGVVTAVYGLSLTGLKPPKENRMIISDTLYEAEDGYAKQFLGQKVSYYYIDDDNADIQPVIYMYGRGGGKITEIKSEDFVSYDADTNKLHYYEKSRSKSIRISAGAEHIVNGLKSAQSMADSFNNMKLGKIIAYDMNNDGICEAVVCENYEIAVVNSNDTAINKVYAKYLDGGVIEKDDYDVVKIYLSSGAGADFSDIHKDDVLSIVRSDDYLEIYISRQTVTGKIEEMTEDSVTIDGEEYPINKYIKEKTQLALHIGDETTLKLNHMGYITEAESNGGGDMEFAYLIRSRFDGFDGFSIKMFTFDRNIKVIETADKVRVDGRTYKAEKLEEAIYKGKEQKPMLIRYGINADGKINQIDTPSTPESRSADESENSLTITMELSVVEYSWVGKIGNKNVILDSTKVLKVPGDDEVNGAPLSKFQVGTPQNLLSGEKQLMEAYQIGNDKNYEEIVLVKSSSQPSTIEDKKYPILIENVTLTINEEDEKRIKISGYNGTTKVSYMFDPEEFPDASVEPGDLILIATDPYGEIAAMETTYKYNGGTPAEQWGSPTINSHSDGYCVTSGWAINMKDNVLKFGYNDSVNISEAYLMTHFPNITYFDGKEAWVASPSEIITAEMNPNAPDRVITTAERHYIHRFYVYRTE